MRQGPGNVGGPCGPGRPGGLSDAGGHVDIGNSDGAEAPILELFEDSNGQDPNGQIRPGQIEHRPGQKPGGDPKSGEGPPPPDVDAGRLCLDLGNYEIIAGVRVGPTEQFLEVPTRLGQKTS